MIAPGTLLQNRYLVEEQIGQGGMGAVFVATDQRFGSRVALKETFFSDPNLRKAFEREAKLLNRLRHHALPRVSDHFTEDEGQFLVMEYIPGADLSEMLKSRGQAFPWREALVWADQLLDALDYLHTQEPAVIHRDIKPQNLKMTARNQIVLLDFGLAKGAPLQTRVTTTGSVLGYSLNYAPLEQMQGTGTDPRSDLYSLGATLYHLLTGTTPPDALTRATAVLNGEEDPLRPASEIHAQVTPGVAAALTRAMSQSAAKRFGSATEMRAALRQAASEAPADADAAPSGFAPAAATIISEQETQLLDDAPAGARLTEARLTKGTQINSSPDAPTLTDIAAATTRAAPHAPTKAPDTESIATSVRAARADLTQRPASRRVIGVIVCAAVLALIAVAAYTRRAAQPSAVESRPTQSVAPTPSPAQNATVESQPTPEASPTEATAPANVVAPAAPKRANATTPARNAANEGKGAGVGRVVVIAPKPPQTPEGVEDAEDAQAEFAPNRPLTKEELRAVIQRAERERRRAMQERRRALEFERRRRRAAPPPPNYP